MKPPPQWRSASAAFNAFFFKMANGRGWICVALVVFASWRPGKALAGALLFAFLDAMQLRLQQGSGEGIPYQVYLMLPYVLSILALVLVARRAAYPQALMKAYRKGSVEGCRMIRRARGRDVGEASASRTVREAEASPTVPDAVSSGLARQHFLLYPAV